MCFLENLFWCIYNSADTNFFNFFEEISKQLFCKLPMNNYFFLSEILEKFKDNKKNWYK